MMRVSIKRNWGDVHRKWVKSDKIYGAFGKNKTHIISSNMRIPFLVDRVGYSLPMKLIAYGMNARKAFHTKNSKYKDCVSLIRSISRAPESTVIIINMDN